MSLQVPYDQLLMEPQYWDYNHPLFVPRVNTLPDLHDHLPFMASMIVNLSIDSLRINALRVVAYNILSYNNWNNNDFISLFSFINDYATMKCLKYQNQDIRRLIEDTVSESLAMYTAKLLYDYPELLNVPGIRSIERDCANLVQAMNQILNEMDRAANPNQGYGGGYQAQGSYLSRQPNRPMQPRGREPITRYNAPVSRGNVGVSQQSAILNVPRDSSVPRYNVGGPTTPTNRFPSVSNVIEPTEVTTEIVKESDVVKTLGMSEGDRRMSQAIKYFGVEVKTDGVFANSKFSEAVENLTEAEASDSEDSRLYKIRMLEPTIECAVVSGKIKYTEHLLKDSSIKAFRCFAIICNPVFYIYQIKDIINKLYSSTNMIELGNNIRSLSKSVGLMGIKEGEEDYVNSVLAIMSEIDNMLTIKLNNFLKYNVDSSLKVDSFSGDILDLCKLITDKKPRELSAAVNRFDKELMKTLKFNTNNDCSNKIRELLDIADDVNISTFAFETSLTYIGIDSKELALNVENEPLVIDDENTPVLYALAASLAKHKTQMEIETIEDYLITSDNVKYKIITNYLNDNVFKLLKV